MLKTTTETLHMGMELERVDEDIGTHGGRGQGTGDRSWWSLEFLWQIRKIPTSLTNPCSSREAEHCDEGPFP